MNQTLRTASLLLSLAAPAVATATEVTDEPTTAATAPAGVTNIHASKKFGLGFGGGAYSSGVTGKVFLGNTLAVQAFASLGWVWGFQVGADVLYQGKQLWTNGDLALNWEAGAGAFIAPGYGAAVGVNGVAGLSLQYRPVPVELTVDVRPTLSFGSWSAWAGYSPFYVSGGGAVRYYF
jgi:hypothetical protein